MPSTVASLSQSVRGTQQTGTASQQLHALSSSLQRQQMLLRKKMVDLRAAYEQKLKSFSEASKQLQKNNSIMLQDIEHLTADTNSRRLHVEDLQKLNAQLFDHMQLLESKVASALAFAAQSTNSSVVDTQVDAEINAPTTLPPMHHVSDHYNLLVSLASKESVEDALEKLVHLEQSNNTAPLPTQSLMEVSNSASPTDWDKSSSATIADFDTSTMRSSAMQPAAVTDEQHNLLNSLQRGLQAMEQEEATSEMRLKSMFMHRLQIETQKHSILSARNLALAAREANSVETARAIAKVERHWEMANQEIKQRLNTTRNYLQGLSNLTIP